MFLFNDARLALGLILALRCAGCSDCVLVTQASLRSLRVVQSICSLFDVVAQTSDPVLSFVALLPDRFPLAFGVSLSRTLLARALVGVLLGGEIGEDLGFPANTGRPAGRLTPYD